MSFDRMLAYAVGVVSAVLVFGLLTTQAAPNEVGHDRAAASHMIERVNEERTAEGLVPLTPAEDVAEVAERWSQQMAASRDMRHNPDFANEICCWRVTTENVAWSEPHRLWRPGDPVLRITDELHEALMGSPGHRANVLDDGVNEVGIGVYVDAEGNVWITQNFRGSVRD